MRMCVYWNRSKLRTQGPGWPPIAPCRLGPARWPHRGWASCHQPEQHSHLCKWEICSPDRLSMSSLTVLSEGGSRGDKQGFKFTGKSVNKLAASHTWWCTL